MAVVVLLLRYNAVRVGIGLVVAVVHVVARPVSTV